jgi:hypothetical protein
MTVRTVLVSSALLFLTGLASLAAEAAEQRSRTKTDRLVGTNRADRLLGGFAADRLDGRGGADFLRGGAGRDTMLGGPGGDRLAAHFDGARDTVSCGAGPDVVNAEPGDAVARDCEVLGLQVARDLLDEPPAQHETLVEPESLAVGSTIVTAFQVGRHADGGAAATAWATSTDGGATWRSGVLERVGDRVSDPVVAYDGLRGVWLIASLGSREVSRELLISRSRDGVTWSRPAVVVADPTESYDKEWLACDSWPTSSFRGRCYLVYLDVESLEIRTRRSTDGGVTWSAPVGVRIDGPETATPNGAFPVVRPDGTLVVAFTVFGSVDPEHDSVSVARSADGGASFATVSKVSPLFDEGISGLRAPPLVSADVDSAGTVYVAWADCRFSTDCTTNGIVLATSRDGIAWTAPRRVPFGPRDGLHRVIPGLAVAPGTSGSRARLAIAAYSVTKRQGCQDCELIDTHLVTSADGGRTWRPPQRLNAESMPFAWLADTGIGRMVGDYVSTSYVRGRPVPVLSLATEPEGGELRQAVFATTRLP